jgi:PqqD family protein of HPr-rel-A system
VTAPVRPRGRDGLVVLELDGEAVVYDEDTGDLHHLNPTATSIFAMCDGRASVRELSAEVAELYGIPVEDVEPQVRRLVRTLTHAGLLTTERAASG